MPVLAVAFPLYFIPDDVRGVQIKLPVTVIVLAHVLTSDAGAVKPLFSSFLVIRVVTTVASVSVVAVHGGACVVANVLLIASEIDFVALTLVVSVALFTCSTGLIAASNPAAKIPRIAMTIINSISVKPFFKIFILD